MSTERTLHLGAWVLAVVGALLALHFHDAKVRADERARVTADSLAHANARLIQHADSALAARDSAAHQDSLRLAQLHEAQRVSQQARTQQDSLQQVIATLGLPDSAKRVIAALETAQAQERASLEAQRDSALALFRNAAASRDTLAQLVRALRLQNQGLSQALVQARRRPIWETTGVRVVELALAAKGLASVLGH